MVGKIYELLYGQPLYVIFGEMLFLIICWSVLAVSFGRKFWLWINIFAVSISALVIIVVTLFSRQMNENTELILIPFYSFAEAKNQPEIYRTMVMNIFLFFPLGLTLPFAFGKKIQNKVGKTILAAVLLSALIETGQYCFGLGRCEVDDVIMNTLGASIGSVSYVIWRKMGERKNSY